jgi:histone H3/H4
MQRISNGAIIAARLFAKTKIKHISDKLTILVQKGKRQTIQTDDVVTVFSEFLPCLLRLSESNLLDEDILRVGNKKTLTANAIGRLVKEHTGLRITEQAKVYLAVGLARSVCTIAKYARIATNSRVTNKKGTATLLKKDINGAVQIVKAQ